ncbi:hypothetical protein Barb7_01371 [Bacteroidales bacterium Barb7]|nr:hypothetical protein Barb7_01371 [Bacteroidales bacterium Barb7]
MGLKEQLPISSERTTGYYRLHFVFVSFFQNFPDNIAPETPHSAALHVELKSCIPSECM